MSSLPPNPKRGEVWTVNFRPKTGKETDKVRPAIVVGDPMIGDLGERVIVPVFTSRSRFKKMPWFVPLPRTLENGQDWDGEIDASKIKSFDVERFKSKRGQVSQEVLQDILDAILLVLGYELKDL